MPSTKNYRELHEKVISREGAAERLAVLRDETLKEIGLDELRRAVNRSQADIAAELSISQSAVSQFERSGDIKVSTLSNYVQGLGARLRQMMLSTHNELPASLFKRNLRPVESGQNTRIVSLTAWRRDGPTVSQRDTARNPAKLALTSS